MPTHLSGHQLAAIMFTDVVGYTAMMEQHESLAVAVVQRHQEVVEALVPSHGGEVLQYYGDGSLSIFYSALEAVQCAIEIQTELNREVDGRPEVPLKIGLHLGEILFQDGKLFGNGVNVASRIESLGQAGTILFSRNIWDNIRNQREYQAVSLGRFAFKNVEDPLEVLALSNPGFPVPAPHNLPDRVKPAGQRRKGWAVAALFTLLLLILSAVLFRTSFFSPAGKYGGGIRDKRVAVMIFDNQTGSEDLAPFGRMLSDFITAGFMETGETKIVIPQSVQENIQLAAAGNTVSPAFVKATGADLIIEGRYYLEGDQLIVHARAIDVARGNEIEAVWTEAGPRDQPTRLLNALAQKILGYWALKGKQRFGDKPPRYDAYREWVRGDEYFGWDYEKSAYHLRRAHTLDSSFYVPLLKMIPLYLNREQQDSAAALIQYIRKKDPPLGQWEELRLESFEEILNGDWERLAAIYEKMMEIAPGDNTSIYMAAYYHNFANHPARSIQIMETYQGPPERKLDFGASLLADAHFKLGHFATVCEIAESYDLEIFPQTLASLHLGALIHLDRRQSFDQYRAYYQTRKMNGPASSELLLFSLVQMEKTGRRDLIRHYTSRLLEEAGDSVRSAKDLALRGYVHYLLGELPQATRHFREALADMPNDPFILGALGSCYALSGHTEQAKEMRDSVLTLDIPYARGSNAYEAARIEANLGNKEEAVALLRKAAERGRPFAAADLSYDSDIFLSSLWDYPPFITLVKPKQTG